LGIFVLATVSVASVPAWRHALLRSIGWALVAQDDLAKADIIVVSSDSLGAGMLEAADLVKAGFAPRVAIFDRPQTPLQRELLRRRARLRSARLRHSSAAKPGCQRFRKIGGRDGHHG